MYIVNQMMYKSTDRGFRTFLADRTNRRAIGTVLCLSVCLSVVCL